MSNPRFPTPSQIAECGGPCSQPVFDPMNCDCGLKDFVPREEELPPAVRCQVPEYLLCQILDALEVSAENADQLWQEAKDAYGDRRPRQVDAFRVQRDQAQSLAGSITHLFPSLQTAWTPTINRFQANGSLPPSASATT